MAFTVINLGKIQEACKKWSRIDRPLANWKKLIINCNANNFSELRKTFNHVDLVNTKTVFNIGGNNWRLIALVNYSNRQVIITYILDHNEYDKGKWK